MKCIQAIYDAINRREAAKAFAFTTFGLGEVWYSPNEHGPDSAHTAVIKHTNLLNCNSETILTLL